VAALVFDSGGLIALERGDRAVGALLAVAVEQGIEAVTSAACVAQAWRAPAGQTRLARALAGFVEHSLDPELARRCGLLLAETRTADVADAAIALLVEDEDTILTSDSRDIARLLRAAGTRARIQSV
jgi:hypothetical protein